MRCGNKKLMLTSGEEENLKSARECYCSAAEIITGRSVTFDRLLSSLNMIDKGKDFFQLVDEHYNKKIETLKSKSNKSTCSFFGISKSKIHNYVVDYAELMRDHKPDKHDHYLNELVNSQDSRIVKYEIISHENKKKYSIAFSNGDHLCFDPTHHDEVVKSRQSFIEIMKKLPDPKLPSDDLVEISIEEQNNSSDSRRLLADNSRIYFAPNVEKVSLNVGVQSSQPTLANRIKH